MVAAGGLIFHRAFSPFVRRYHLARRERSTRGVEQNVNPVKPLGAEATTRSALLWKRAKAQ